MLLCRELVQIWDVRFFFGEVGYQANNAGVLV